jgi:hypothetical protein
LNDCGKLFVEMSFDLPVSEDERLPVGRIAEPRAM